MIIGHGGNIHELAHQLACDPKNIVDMSSNMNPLGPPPDLMEHLNTRLESIFALPEADAGRMKTAAAKWLGISANRLLAENGTTQFIYTLPRALKIKQALILAPTYADYADACRMQGVACDYIYTSAAENFTPNITALEQKIAGNDAVFICNPNNPTGRLVPAADLAPLCRRHPKTWFIIDESYLPFVLNSDKESLMHTNLENVLILSSMSKIFRIPGLRVGFLIGHEKLIQKLSDYSMPWGVNSLAQEAVCYLLTQTSATKGFIESTRDFVAAERHRFVEYFRNLPKIRFFPSETDFLLAELKGLTADMVWTEMARHRILIRNCSNFNGLSDNFIRISLKNREENEKAADLLKQIVK